MATAKKKRSPASTATPKTVKIEEKRIAMAAMHSDSSIVPLVSAKQCSHLLNVGMSTLARLVKSGSVPSVMVGGSRKFDILAVRSAIERKS